ncbi:MAG: CapA family protein [Acidobacteria bacterium]|nr:CapA family protein [Acidobacteriota bacterium]
MREFVRFRAATLLLSLGAAGCGSGGSASTNAYDTAPPEAVVAATDPTTIVPASTTTVVAAPVTISLAFAGDVLIHSQVWKAATVNAGGSGFDFTPMFARVKPLIESVDLAICHLEVPLVAPGEKPTTNPLYSAPTEIAFAIKDAGFDRCSTASNHTFDKGAKGIKATLDEFDSLGLGYAGMARTPDEIEPKVFDVKGINVTHLSYTYGFNGISAPNDEAWRSARIDPERILADAKRARDQGANVVIVSMHWGRETRTDLSEFQVTNADAITKSGLIDLVIGHHAHVVQQVEKINGVWTVFGLGNLISYLPTTKAFSANTQDGIIATTNITLNPDGTVIVEKPRVHPIWVDKKNGVVVRPVISDMADPSVPTAIKADLEVSLQRTRSVVGDFVVIDP